jgi:hypothetical protein
MDVNLLGPGKACVLCQQLFHPNHWHPTPIPGLQQYRLSFHPTNHTVYDSIHHLGFRFKMEDWNLASEDEAKPSETLVVIPKL